MFNQNLFTDDDVKKIWICSYCGENAPKGQKYCSTCKTQSARKNIFDENTKIIQQNVKLGYTVPETIKNWK